MVILVFEVLSAPDSELPMFLEVKGNAQVGEHKLVRIWLVHPWHGVPQRVPVLDKLAPRVDNLVFLVCDDNVQGCLAAWVASPAAIVGFVLGAAEIKSEAELSLARYLAIERSSFVY